MKAWLVSVGMGLGVGIARIRKRELVVIAGLVLLLALLTALVEQRASPPQAVDRSLAGLSAVLLPICVLAVHLLQVGSSNFRDALWSLARFGQSRAALAVGFVGATGLVSIAIVVPAAWLVIVMLRALGGGLAGSPTTMADLFTTTWILTLAALAYSGWLSFGATFGRKGWGRWVLLAADFLLGAAGVSSLFVPRGATQHLIGSGAPFELSQRASSLVLLALIGVYCAATALRCRDR